MQFFLILCTFLILSLHIDGYFPSPSSIFSRRCNVVDIDYFITHSQRDCYVKSLRRSLGKLWMQTKSASWTHGSDELTEDRENFMSELHRISRLPPSEITHVTLPQKDLAQYLEFIASNENDTDSISERQWITLLELSLKHRNVTLSNMIFEEMAKRSLSCDSIHMMGLLSQKDHNKAYEIWHTALSLGMQPSVHNFSPLLKRSNSTTRTRELLQQMDYYGIEPNVITLTAAIKSCEATGDWKFALDLLDLMRAVDILPNEITYSCAISVCSNGAAGSVALNILREMQSMDVTVNMITYASALVACARSSLWTEVHKLFTEMELLNIPIHESVLISVINVCRDPKFYLHHSDLPKWKRAIEFMNEYASEVSEATESLYTIVMDVCEGANRPAEVVNTFKKMINRNIKGTKSAFSFVIRACAKLNNVNLALEIIHDYRRIGGCSAYMIEDVAILSAGLGELEVAIKVLYLASSDISLDRPISNRVTKKVVSKALELYDGRKMNASNSVSNEQMKSTTAPPIYSMPDSIEEFRISGEQLILNNVSNISESYSDILLNYLRYRIKDESSPLLLSNSAQKIAKKFLIDNREEYLAQKLFNVSFNCSNSQAEMNFDLKNIHEQKVP